MKRLHDNTSVKINGFYPELENVNGLVVGYVDDNPIVKIPVELSKEYPYKTLIVPRQHVKEDEVMYEIEFAILYSSQATEWRAKFCRNAYKKLMNAIQKTTGIKSTDSITEEVIITPTADYHTGSHRYGLHNDGLHHFTLTVIWSGYPEYVDKGRITTEFKFDIVYDDPCPENEQAEDYQWFKNDWHGYATVEVSWLDKTIVTAKPEPPVHKQYHSAIQLNLPHPKYRISLQTGIKRLVSAWWKMHQKAEQIRKKS